MPLLSLLAVEMEAVGQMLGGGVIALAAATATAAISAWVNRKEGTESRIVQQEETIRVSLYERVQTLESRIEELSNSLDESRRETLEVLEANGMLKVENESLRRTNEALSKEVDRLAEQVTHLTELVERYESLLEKDEET